MPNFEDLSKTDPMLQGKIIERDYQKTNVLFADDQINTPPPQKPKKQRTQQNVQNQQVQQPQTQEQEIDFPPPPIDDNKNYKDAPPPFSIDPNEVQKMMSLGDEPDEPDDYPTNPNAGGGAGQIEAIGNNSKLLTDIIIGIGVPKINNISRNIAKININQIRSILFVNKVPANVEQGILNICNILNNAVDSTVGISEEDARSLKKALKAWLEYKNFEAANPTSILIGTLITIAISLTIQVINCRNQNNAQIEMIMAQINIDYKAAKSKKSFVQKVATMKQTIKDVKNVVSDKDNQQQQAA